jgi:hypothetical protein
MARGSPRTPTEPSPLHTCTADVWCDGQAHPIYRALVEGTDCPEYGDYRMLEHVTAQFKRAAEMNANDGDVSSALGVLCNLSRDYDEVPTSPALRDAHVECGWPGSDVVQAGVADQPAEPFAVE